MERTKLSGTFYVTEAESNAFARLSGDYNPLHVDPVYSRRLQYGCTVLHGVHHLLRVWDEAINVLQDDITKGVLNVSASFHFPVSVGDTINYEVSFDNHSGILEILTACSSKRALTLRITFQSTAIANPEIRIPDNVPFESIPDEQEFPLTSTSGVCKLNYSSRIGSMLFKSLDKKVDKSVISNLLATSKIVGMHCPGLHSIFSSLELTFGFQDISEYKSEISYSVRRMDQRVSLIDIDLSGNIANGVIKTFFRPPPVDQPTYGWVCERVGRQEFIDQRALIVGGSRGIGEATAKIIAAGGGDVLLTYRGGITDAQHVMSEIKNVGGKCDIVLLDILKNGPLEDKLLSGHYSHIYYYASPRILSNSSICWDEKVFEKYQKYYVSAFSNFIDGYLSNRKDKSNKITVFYPSTSYIESPSRGFYEYAAAKNAGEFACKKLSNGIPLLRIACPRLPKMDTDQTASLIRKQNTPVFDVIYRELQHMNS